MIALTRLNGRAVLLNCDLIESAEREADGTVVVLTTGNSLVVRETPEQIADAVVAFKRKIYARGEA